MTRLFALLLAACLALAATAAHAERVVANLSTDLIEITSSYDGERITFFGSIEPQAGAGQRFVEGPFHVVIVVTGPAQDRLARQKTRQLGIWLNTDEVLFERFPSFYQVLSSGRLLDITDPTTLAVQQILPETQPGVSGDAGWWRSSVFGRELVRLMTERGLFGLNQTGVQFQSETFYSARLILPAEAPPGPYLAQTYVFKDGEIVARTAHGFAVRKTGFERFLATSAVQYPLLYGLACVALALFTGWLGGIIFRR
jgi:uncharacterized protein (TIGR02186 family)